MVFVGIGLRQNFSICLPDWLGTHYVEWADRQLWHPPLASLVLVLQTWITTPRSTWSLGSQTLSLGDLREGTRQGKTRSRHALGSGAARVQQIL